MGDEHTAYIWVIENVSKKLDGTGSLFSPEFYTKVGGYKMQLRAALNGLENGKGTHISLYYGLVKGAYDDTLPFPYPENIKLTLVGPKGVEDKSKLLNTPQAEREKEALKKFFGKPTAATAKSTYTWGFAQFLEKEQLAQFISHDSLCVKATVVGLTVAEKLENAFKRLQGAKWGVECKSLLKKHLSSEIYGKTKDLVTESFNSSLLDCIQSGAANLDSGVGIYAPDAEAYSVFSALFDPIIEEYHAGFKQDQKHPDCDFGDVNSFQNLDPEGTYVVSTRVRGGRSLEGYPFNPCLTEAQYKEMEAKVTGAFEGLEGELKGTYFPLTGMTKEVQQQLIDDHFLFKEGDRFLQHANACRYWPSGRGIFHNEKKNFLVWVNEEDHLRIISMQMGGDLGEVYRRWVSAVNSIEKLVKFSHHDRLGFLTFCPTNLGTTVRASVHIKVPKLAKDYSKLEAVAAKYSLQVRGTAGEHTESVGGVYDISNKRRMGLTEFEAVKEMQDGILEIIKAEKEMPDAPPPPAEEPKKEEEKK